MMIPDANRTNELERAWGEPPLWLAIGASGGGGGLGLGGLILLDAALSRALQASGFDRIESRRRDCGLAVMLLIAVPQSEAEAALFELALFLQRDGVEQICEIAWFDPREQIFRIYGPEHGWFSTYINQAVTAEEARRLEADIKAGLVGL